MKRSVKVPVTYDSEMTVEELIAKMDEANGEIDLTSNLKGREIYLWRHEGENTELRFYHSYRSDMCDTMFSGTLRKGLKGSQLDGFIKKPAGIWGVFWTIIGLALLLTLGLAVTILLSDTIDAQFVLLAPVILIVAAFIGASLLRFDKGRLADINSYLRKFTGSENTDVLGEDLEADERD